MSRYLAVKIRPRDRAVEVNPQNDYLPHFLKHLKIISFPDEALSLKNLSPDYLVLNGNLHIERDIHSFFTSLRNSLRPATRLIIIYYSSLWKPILMMATRFGMRDRTIETNWITTGDITNFLELSGCEVISDEARVLVPIYIPFLSDFLNRRFAPLPMFNVFCMVHIMTARPSKPAFPEQPSMSVVIPDSNEACNIEDAVTRIPNLAHLINRLFLLLGIQPMCIDLHSSHVRGFTHKAFEHTLKSTPGITYIDCEGSELIYPLPLHLARPLSKMFIGICAYVCYLVHKE